MTSHGELQFTLSLTLTINVLEQFSNDIETPPAPPPPPYNIA